ncbi:MAG: EamA family transporter, partial [Deltaproteobacteria bacterium]|nr:EamA family transporter [Deltaproteobacteria bacterium]
SMEVPTPRGLVGAAYIGTFEMGVAFVAWLQALKLSRTTAQVGQLIYLTPFLSLLVIAFVVGEPIYKSTLAGLALIIGGIVLQRRSG